MKFLNSDLRKDIEAVVNVNKKLRMTSTSKRKSKRDEKLIDDLVDLFERWYDMRVSACLV